MDPGLALAIDSCVGETSSLIVAFLKRINEVRVFKAKCAKLGNEASLLHQLLDRKRNAVRNLQTIHNFKAFIRKVENFVDSCRTWSISTVSLEVFVRHEYSSLLKDLNALRDVFLFDSVTEILVREGVSSRKILKNQESHTEILMSLKKNLEERDRRERQLSSATLSQIQPDFDLDQTFTLTFEAEEPFYGKGSMETVGPIVCYPIQPSKSAKENLDIYRDIQEGAYVQRFHGTLMANQKYYVVMEDMTSESTLGQACLQHLPQLTLLERAQLCSDLAKSMAWYHKADLLLKSVTDHTVILKTLPSGRLCPVLTNLENLRTIHQKTPGHDYDIRYEAPEFQFWKEHSMATDVWRFVAVLLGSAENHSDGTLTLEYSLGIVIWQCLSCQIPYGVKEPVVKDTEECEAIRKRLRDGDLPGLLENDRKTSRIFDLIRQCWRRDPMSRTTADAVARALQGLCASMSLPSLGVEQVAVDFEDQSLAHVDTETIQQSALKAVQAARRLNQGSPRFVQSAHRISKEDFRGIIDDDDGSNSIISFIIGAAFWWNIADLSFEEAEGSSTVATSLTYEGKRVAVALKYLENAVNSGYSPAYFEVYKAHAFLAHKFQDHLHRWEKELVPK